jgi:hypothetical protein
MTDSYVELFNDNAIKPSTQTLFNTPPALQ